MNEAVNDSIVAIKTCDAELQPLSKGKGINETAQDVGIGGYRWRHVMKSGYAEFRNFKHWYASVLSAYPIYPMAPTMEEGHSTLALRML